MDFSINPGLLLVIRNGSTNTEYLSCPERNSICLVLGIDSLLNGILRYFWIKVKNLPS